MIDENQIFNSNSYIPLQPELERNMLYYMDHQESGSVDCLPVLFYQFRSSDFGSTEFLAIPDGHVDIIFQCSSQRPHVYVYGTVLSSKPISVENNTEYFGVRILSLHHSRKSHLAMKELTNRVCSLEDFASIDYTNVERIMMEHSFHGRIKIFKEVFKDLFLLQSTSQLVHSMLGQIYATKGTVSIKELSTQTGYSDRYLRQRFEDYVGISPKLFCRITRFQYVLRRMLQNPNPSVVWNVIGDSGYYDQAHFINEFKRFHKETPQRWAQRFSIK